MNKKIIPLDVVYVCGKLCIKALKFETIESELIGIDTWEYLLNKRTIITDVNNNIIKVSEFLKLLETEKIITDLNKMKSSVKEDNYKEIFKTHLYSLRFKVYIIVGTSDV